VKSGADGQKLDEIDHNNSEFRCQTKLLKMPDCWETIPPNLSNFDMAAKMHKKHKDKAEPTKNHKFNLT